VILVEVEKPHRQQGGLKVNKFIYSYLITSLLFAGLVWAQTEPNEEIEVPPAEVLDMVIPDISEKPQSAEMVVPDAAAMATQGEVFNFFRDNKTFIRDPFTLRDPFKRKKTKTRSDTRKFSMLQQGNTFSNIPTIGTASLDEIRIVGVLLGKDRRATAKKIAGDGLSKESYILVEGMKLGENQAEIKAILPGGIVLVEKIRNVYDQDEFIETIIPVTSGI
jgi:type IV pilus assembly protein PilP